MKKIFAISLLLLLLVSLGVSAFADNGSITISNTTINQKYTLYKIFSATVNTSTNPVGIAYYYDGVLPADNGYFTQDTDKSIHITAAGQDTTGHLTSGAVAFLGTLKGEMVEEEVASSNTITFSGLDYGYYYIESTLGEKAVSIDSTKPTATLFDKNQRPDWHDPEGNVDLGKYIVLANGNRVTENSVSFGDDVDFEITFNATDYVRTDKVLSYYLTDTICEGFQIDKSSLKVYYDNVEKTENTDYKVYWSNGDRTFVISAPWAAADNVTSLYEANVVIKVTYTAKLLTNAVIASPGNPNIAYFDYRIGADAYKPGTADPFAPPPTALHRSQEKTTVTYTYALGLTKIDGKDKTNLKGAEFTLSKGTGATPIKANEETSGVYEYDKNGAVTQFKTNDDGVLIIKGLEEGSYTLNEAKAPDGYNRTLAGKTVTFTKGNIANYVEEHTVYFDSNGIETTTATATKVTTDYNTNVLAVVFENQRGLVLPITGGMGTTVFYVLGGGLMFVAILLLIARKRMHDEK